MFHCVCVCEHVHHVISGHLADGFGIQGQRRVNHLQLAIQANYPAIWRERKTGPNKQTHQSPQRNQRTLLLILLLVLAWFFCCGVYKTKLVFAVYATLAINLSLVLAKSLICRDGNRRMNGSN